MARFSDIILALVAKVGEVVADENAIIVTARRELPVLVGDFDVLLRVRNMRVEEGTVAAAGRYFMPIRRYVDIIIRARQYADVSKHDLQWLTDETNGILDKELQLIEALEMWHPVAGMVGGTTPIVGDNPQFLLIEPARVITGEDPTRDVVSRAGVTDPGYGMLGFRLDTYYSEELNQAIQ